MDHYFLLTDKTSDLVESLKPTPPPNKAPRWWMGGLSAMGAACFTHPLDLVKVHLQTQSETASSSSSSSSSSKKPGMIQLGRRVVANDGILGLWNGLSASLFRQGTYATARFALYQSIQSQVACDVSLLTIPQKIIISAVAGCPSGLIAVPGGKVNVRMQDDMRVKPAERRNYKHVFDGIIHVYREGGLKKGLFSGGTVCMGRATVINVGQVGLYDVAKTFYVLPFRGGVDDVITHLISSCMAGTIAAVMAQPLDVMKTRVLNAPADRNGVGVVFMDTWKTCGLLGFYKGLLPAWIRLLPQTILTFLFFEQFKLHFGYEKPPC